MADITPISFNVRQMILGLYYIWLAPRITPIAVRVIQLNSAITKALSRLSKRWMEKAVRPRSRLLRERMESDSRANAEIIQVISVWYNSSKQCLRIYKGTKPGISTLTEMPGFCLLMLRPNPHRIQFCFLETAVALQFCIRIARCQVFWLLDSELYWK